MNVRGNNDLSKSRILIVSDYPIVRRGMMRLINDQPELRVTGEAEEPVEAIRLFEATQPDLTIIDLALRNEGAIPLVKQIRTSSPHAKILALSEHPGFLFARHVLRIGAMGFINKHEPADKLIDAIRNVLSGGVYSGSSLSEGESLSDLESTVLRLIGQGRTTEEIAASLHLSPETVETHREDLKAKLGLTSDAELYFHAVVLVLEEGK